MTRFIDNVINLITMYRLVLYGLITIAVYSIIVGFLGRLDYSGLRLIYSLIISFGVCYFSNWALSKVFKAPTNVESWMITALIIFCLFMPMASPADALTFVYAGVIAMASKYILAIQRRHIFNPAALSAVILSVNPSTVAFWWVGTPVMLPVVLVVGFLVVRKIRKFSMLFSFLAASFAGTFIFGVFTQRLSQELFAEMVLSGPLIFFGTIMLTEPFTMPPRKKLQMIYGGIVGGLSFLQFNIGLLYSSPELALIIGNVFSYIVSPKYKLFLRFKERQKIAKDTYEFVFESERLGGILGGRGSYKPGQYMEWTLPHLHSDSRGVRRYFTVASSPKEDEVKLGVRIGGQASSFKKKLLSLTIEDHVIAAQLGGDFVLPEDKNRKLVFLAGGIGVTPFRSMAKYLLDIKDKRDIVLIYFNKSEEEIAYKDIFEQAKAIGLKTIYVLTDREHAPSSWRGRVGRLDGKMLSTTVSDFRERTFYLSGPNALVNNYKHILLTMGISRANIITDYFPGF